MCTCGERPAIARGLCRRCYDRAHHRRELGVVANSGRPRKWCATLNCRARRWPESRRHCQVHELQLRYPSCRFGVEAWVAAFGVKPGMLEAILDDIASKTRSAIDRGVLRLDDRGREIPTRGVAALDAA